MGKFEGMTPPEKNIDGSSMRNQCDHAKMQRSGSIPRCGSLPHLGIEQKIDNREETGASHGESISNLAGCRDLSMLTSEME